MTAMTEGKKTNEMLHWRKDKPCHNATKLFSPNILLLVIFGHFQFLLVHAVDISAKYLKR